MVRNRSCGSSLRFEDLLLISYKGTHSLMRIEHESVLQLRNVVLSPNPVQEFVCTYYEVIARLRIKG